MFIIRSRNFIIYLTVTMATLILGWFLAATPLTIPRGAWAHTVTILAGDVLIMVFACLGVVLLAPGLMAMWELRRTRAKLLAATLGLGHILVSLSLTFPVAFAQQQWMLEKQHAFGALVNFILTPTAIICASLAVAGVALLGPLNGSIAALVVYIVVEGFTLLAAPEWSPFPQYGTQNAAQFILAALIALVALACAYVTAGSPPNAPPGQSE